MECHDFSSENYGLIFVVPGVDALAAEASTSRAGGRRWLGVQPHQSVTCFDAGKKNEKRELGQRDHR